jgi:hypothetical protein
MKKTIWLSALVLGLFALPTPACAWYVPPYRVDAGFKLWFNVQPLGPQPNLAPWYLYYPYDAHFQTPAPGPIGYYPQYAQPQGGMYATPRHQPLTQPTPPLSQPLYRAPPTVRPASYYYSPAPSYWYGR